MHKIRKIPILFFTAALLWYPGSAAALEDWFATGLAALRARQYAEALSAFNKALETNPRHANAYNGRGAVWHQLGAYDRAIADYTRALEINPRYASAYNNRGVARYQQGGCDDAIKDYDRALEINPNYVNALINRGAAWRKKGEYEQAIADFNAALSIRPTYEACNLLAWTLATCPVDKFRNGRKAVELAENAVAMKTEIRSLSTLAAAYAEADRFDDAIATQKRVIDLLQKEGKEKKLVEHMARLKTFQSGFPLGKKAPVRSEIIEKDLSEKPQPQKPVSPPPQTAAVETGAIQTVPSHFPYTVQISSFRNPHTAFREALKLREKGDPAFNSHAYLPSKGGDWFRLFIGIYETADEALKGAEKLKQRKFRYARVIKTPWAVQVGPAGPDPALEKTEMDLRQKEYLPYRVPPWKDHGKSRLLIGAFASKKAALQQADRLRKDGFSPQVVRR